MKTLEDILSHYKISIKALILISSIDKWTLSELEDIEYIASRVETHIEMSQKWLTK